MIVFSFFFFFCTQKALLVNYMNWKYTANSQTMLLYPVRFSTGTVNNNKIFFLLFSFVFFVFSIFFSFFCFLFVCLCFLLETKSVYSDSVDNNEKIFTQLISRNKTFGLIVITHWRFWYFWWFDCVWVTKYTSLDNLSTSVWLLKSMN